jgi:hypothetical protein
VAGAELGGAGAGGGRAPAGRAVRWWWTVGACFGLHQREWLPSGAESACAVSTEPARARPALASPGCPPVAPLPRCATTPRLPHPMLRPLSSRRS